MLETVQEERCTSLYGVPTMFIAELDHPEFERFDLSSLRTGIMAGSPCPVEVMRRVQSQMHMHEVTICYGMTETSPVSTQTALDDPLEKRVGSVGRVHPHVEIKIVDPASGAIVPRGAPGELCTRGYSVMLGYWNNDEATRGAIDEAALDAHRRPRDDGRRGVRQHRRPDQGHDHPGRREHLPARDRGVPVHPPGRQRRPGHRRAERALRRRGDGLDQAARGRRPVDDDLDAYCRGKIATYKIPRYWKLVDGFPMTVTGKIQKFRMREQAVEELGLQSEAAIRMA